MTVTIKNPQLSGKINAIPSKSDVHRILIAAALCDKPTKIRLSFFSEDIKSTLSAIASLGAEAEIDGSSVIVSPAKLRPLEKAIIDCGESGSTARFILPVAAALGGEFTIAGHGRLPERPFDDLCRVLDSFGCKCSQSRLPITVSGRLMPGNYSIRGDVSSQYITGLLLALPVCGGGKISLTTPLESTSYVRMTLDTLSKFGVNVTDGISFFEISKSPKYSSPGEIIPDGDWSNGAFFLAAQALGCDITVTGLCRESLQGDKIIEDIIPLIKNTGCEIDASDIPDLVPVIAVLAAAQSGKTIIYNASRLRLKESDRIKTTAAMLRSLGGKVSELSDGLEIEGTGSLQGGTVDSSNDHRIAMAAAVASIICKNDVTINGAECVNKSYPGFFKDFSSLCRTGYVMFTD